MSDYYVKKLSKDGRNAEVVFHVPIPVENNSVGVSSFTAVAEYITPDFVSAIPNIDAAELTKLQNGELFELVRNVKFLAADTNAEKQAKIDATFTAMKTLVVEEGRVVLSLWGLNRNVT